MFYQKYFHPICENLYLVSDLSELKGIFFSEEKMRNSFTKESWIKESTTPIKDIIIQFERYFDGEQRKFYLLPICLEGTLFQKKIWGELVKIPYGEVITYGEMAERIGHPGASRAVGQACKANPFPLLIPCHRVVGKNGKLTGYAGNLVSIKERLILHEKKHQLKNY